MAEIDIQEIGLTPGYKVVAFPFVKEAVSLIGEEGSYETVSWRPGVRFENDERGNCDSFADGMGHMMLTVVGVFKPDGFPTRVFYTRKFSDPNGHVFGKGSLKICTIQKFRRLIKGYAYPFEMAANA